MITVFIRFGDTENKALTLGAFLMGSISNGYYFLNNLFITCASSMTHHTYAIHTYFASMVKKNYAILKQPTFYIFIFTQYCLIFKY